MLVLIIKKEKPPHLDGLEPNLVKLDKYNSFWFFSCLKGILIVAVDPETGES